MVGVMADDVRWGFVIFADFDFKKNFNHFSSQWSELAFFADFVKSLDYLH